MKIVYSPRYNITLFGIERLHPFDSCKYGRAWKEIKRTNREALYRAHVPVDRPVTDDELLMVHRHVHIPGQFSVLISIAAPSQSFSRFFHRT